MSRSPSPSDGSSSPLSGVESSPDTEILSTLSPAARKSAAAVAKAIMASTTTISTPTPAAKKRARKTSVKTEEDGEAAAVKSAAAKGKKAKVKAETEDAFEVEEGDEEEDVKAPAKKPRKKAEPKLDADGNPIPRKKPQPKLDADGNPIPRKKRAPKPEPVYVIPEIEQHLSTSFRGRLGYACLNTILRKAKPEPIFCSRTLRLKTIEEKGREYMLELGRQNARDLATLIQWNEDNNIRFMRLSSEMFPFASHEEHGYNLDYAKPELEAAGALARKYGHRVTTHPGQYTQLGSRTKKTVENAKRDLIYHCQILDLMGMGNESVMIIHGGGMHEGKAESMQRFRENFKTLPENVQHRLVLENDEMCYNSDDLLPICEELEIPHVFDYHHDWIYPSKSSVAELMPRILATWNVRGGIRPKMHLSEPRPGAVSKMERRAHSDRIKRLPDVLPPDCDLMLEAKDKEQAVLELYRVYGLASVKHESLRPPAEVETLATAGRKSHKKKKSGSDAEEGDEDGEELSPTKRKRISQKRALAAAELDGEPGVIDQEEGVLPNPEDDEAAAMSGQKPTPKAKRARKSAAKKPVEAELVEEKPEVEPETVKPPSAKRRRVSKAAVVEDSDEEMDE